MDISSHNSLLNKYHCLFEKDRKWTKKVFLKKQCFIMWTPLFSWSLPIGRVYAPKMPSWNETMENNLRKKSDREYIGKPSHFPTNEGFKSCPKNWFNVRWTANNVNNESRNRLIETWMYPSVLLGRIKPKSLMKGQHMGWNRLTVK